MRIGLIGIDGKKPNLALMKISTYYKNKGHFVKLINIDEKDNFDKVYGSKIFSWGSLGEEFDDVRLAGSGIDFNISLPEEIEHLCPDYSLYDMDYSMGFLTRGCIRNCDFCIVPKKEGKIRRASDIEEFLKHDQVVLLDNNVLAHPYGLKQIEKIIKLKIKVDFNQGLDARLIDNDIAKLLSNVRWLKPLRLACDNSSMERYVERAVKLLHKNNVTPKRYFCYMLVKDDIEEAHERALFLDGLKIDPFAQPYRDREGNESPKEFKRFARWVNHKAIFRSVKWEDYDPKALNKKSKLGLR